MGWGQETSSGSQRRPDRSGAAPRSAAPHGAPPEPQIPQPGDVGSTRPPASIGSPGFGPAYPCGGAPHWPARRPAWFRCAHWLPLPDPRRGRRWIGGPAAASSPWRRPCSPPRPGRPPGSPQLSPLFGLQPPPRSARAPAPPDPGLPLRCGKACPAPRRSSRPPRPSPGQAGPSRAGDRSPGPGGGQARGEGPCQRGRARRGHLRAAPRSARLWAQRRDAVTRDPLWDERRKVPGKPSGSQQE